MAERRRARKRSAALTAAESALRTFALALPEAHEDFPWGERVVKVRGKVFLFLGGGEEALGLSVKLPHSKEFALEQPFTSPTRYRLGQFGWVSARFEGKERPPLDLLRRWVLESYRAVAPKRLAAEVEDRD